MKKLYRPTSKTFWKMAGGKMCSPDSTPLDPHLAICYGNHQKSLAYLSHLALGLDQFICFLILKFKLIDFEKTKFKFINFEKTKFKFINFEKMKFKFKFIDFEKTKFKFIDFEKTKFKFMKNL